jgi:integrase
MKPTKLTKRVVDGIAPAAKTALYWDADVKGFALRVTAAGVKTYVVRYRTIGGRDRLMKLGRHGVVTVEQAREAARLTLADVARGEDPQGVAAEARAAPDISGLLDRYLAEHVDVKNAPRTRVGVRHMVDRLIRPAIGTIKVAELQRRDLMRFAATLSDRPRTHNLALAILSKAMNLAEAWGLRQEQTNPVRLVARHAIDHRERHLSDAELVRLGAVLSDAGSIGLPWTIMASGDTAKHVARVEHQRTPVNPDALAVIRFLLFTGARVGEARMLRWDDVDVAGGTVALPGKKGGGLRSHPISAAALGVIREQARRTTGRYVFPAPKMPEAPVSESVVSNAWQRVRAAASVDDVRIHDLRHTFGTAAGKAGANAFLVRDMLRHKTTAMTQVYVNRSDEPTRAMNDRVAGTIEALLSGRSADVVPMPTGPRRPRKPPT